MTSLLEEVPSILREPFPSYETVLPGALPSFLAEEVKDIGAALGYISGAVYHQERVSSTEEKIGSKVFKGVIDKVTFDERKSGDYVLGKKAIIHFTAAGQGGADEEQTIATDWYEYKSYNPELESFWLALSQTIVRIAEENIGIECLIRKAFKPAQTANGGNSVRYIANLTPIAGGKTSKASDSKPSRSRVVTDDDEIDSATISKWVKAHKDAGDVYDEGDVKIVKKVINGIVDTFLKKDIDDRYDEFVDFLDLDENPSRKLKNSILDALELKTDKEIACELFIIGVEELDS